MKRFLIVSLVPFALAGCEKLEDMGIVKSDKQTLVKGKRETVLKSDEASVPVVSPNAGPVVLSESVLINDWPQQGQNSSHATPHAQLPDQLKLTWQTKLGVKANSNQRLLCEPIVAEGMIFIFTPDSFVTAYDLKEGRIQWTIFIKPESRQDAILGGGVAYNKGTLFVATPFADLFAIDVKSGKPLWKNKVSGPLRAAPTVNNGRVFVISLNNELTAYEEESGKLLWSHEGVTESTGLLGGSTPSVQGDVILAPYSSGELFALQAESGLPLWSENLASAHRTDSFAGMPHIRAQPVLKDGVAYVVSQGGNTAAFDLNTGVKKWHQEFGGSQTPTVSGNSVFMITGENHMICMNKDNGLIRWIKHLPKWQDEAKRKGRIVWNGPLLAGSKLYITGSEGHMFVLNALDGTLIAEEKLPGKVVVPAISVGSSIYMVTDTGMLVAYR